MIPFLLLFVEVFDVWRTILWEIEVVVILVIKGIIGWVSNIHAGSPELLTSMRLCLALCFVYLDLLGLFLSQLLHVRPCKAISLPCCALLQDFVELIFVIASTPRSLTWLISKVDDLVLAISFLFWHVLICRQISNSSVIGIRVLAAGHLCYDAYLVSLCRFELCMGNMQLPVCQRLLANDLKWLETLVFAWEGLNFFSILHVHIFSCLNSIMLFTS